MMAYDAYRDGEMMMSGGEEAGGRGYGVEGESVKLEEQWQ